MGDRGIQYDWTFAMGACIFDKIDYRTILQQNMIPKSAEEKNEEEEISDDDNDEDSDEKDCKPGYNIRKIASKIDTSWLCLANSLDMIYDMIPTAGFLYMILSYQIQITIIS